MLRAKAHAVQGRAAHTQLVTSFAHSYRFVPRAAASGSDSCAQAPETCSTSAPVLSRRAWLAAVTLALISKSTRRALANEEDDLAAQLPSTGLSGGSGAEPSSLPRAYTQTARKLISALRESIQAEADGAGEFEVRRKADPAKELVKQFVGKWRESPAVVGDPSHAEISDAISELGAFYRKQGPRSALTRNVAESVLAHLAAAEAALPAQEKKSLLGL